MVRKNSIPRSVRVRVDGAACGRLPVSINQASQTPSPNPIKTMTLTGARNRVEQSWRRCSYYRVTGSPQCRSNTWSGKNTWKGANWDGGRRHHHRFRNSAFIGVGFGAGFYGGYDSCWRLVPTYWGGWRRVWVCDYDYPYWGY